MATEDESLPVEIEPEETLLRSVRKKDVRRSPNPADSRVKVGAIKPGSADRGTISLIRGRIGSGAAKAAAKEHVHGREYWGFGVARAGELNENCVEIVDDRDTFVGHANLVLGLEVPVGPPHTPPHLSEVYGEAMEQLRQLSESMRIVEDPEPDGIDWTGSALDA